MSDKNIVQVNPKKLMRKSDKKVLGVCAGLGDYFGVDPTIVRLIWIVTTAMTGFFPGFVAYIVVAFVMPVEK